MRKTVKYSSVEKVLYEFDEADIRRAILKDNKIQEYRPDRTLLYEIYEDDREEIVIDVTLIFEKDKVNKADD